MLITPGGKPAWTISSPRASDVSGVFSDGLTTIVLPQARAGESFQ